MALAGLWDTWKDPLGKEIESFTIIVRPAEPEIADIHDRMPAILPEEYWNRWLSPETREWAEMKKELLFGYPGPLYRHEVGRRVNSSKNEGEDLIRQINSE